MYVKKIDYVDYDGNNRSENFYFNLSKAEVAEMQLTHPGGYSEYLERIIAAKDQSSLLNAFKELILKAYGEKSEDGRRFVKSPELSEAFSQTEAYSELYMEMLGDADAASSFVNGIMPHIELTDEQKRQLEKEKQKALGAANAVSA